MPREALAVLAARARALNGGFEIQGFGRASLALSARCYHARAHGRTKDNCQFVCEQDVDGMTLNALDGAAFLAVNGIQTLSRVAIDALPDLDRLVAAGVGAFRLSPQTGDMAAVARLFRDRLDGRIDAPEASARLAALRPDLAFGDGFLFGAAGAETRARA